MTYKGIVKGNTIFISQPVELLDGTEVEIIPLNLSDPVCGTWYDERDADEIVKEIRSARYSKAKLMTINDKIKVKHKERDLLSHQSLNSA